MYKSNFAVAIISNGKIMRENKDVITLPFLSDYSILLRNLNSVKSVVKVSVDGEDVLNGKSIIVNPNDKVELEGFLEGTEVKNKFRFIQKTEQISNYRGDKIEDGLIIVEYRFEKIIPYVASSYQPVYIKGRECNNPNCSTTNAYSSTIDNRSFTRGVNLPKQYNNGITVKGTETSQHFNVSWTNELEEHSNVIVLKLVGKTISGKLVTKLRTVVNKLTCPICGKKSKSNCKYCSNCGTFLL